MSWAYERHENEHGQEYFLVRDLDGKNSLKVFSFGATVTSWIHNNQEKLYVSENSLINGAKAIRGGIPLVFPQFGNPISHMPSHGFARLSHWIFVSFESNSDRASLSFSLSDNDATLNQWPNRFKLTYFLDITKNGLTCRLNIHNTDDHDFSCHALFHTYFAVPDINLVDIYGLNGFSYVDKVQNLSQFTEDRDVVTISSETDRIYNPNSSNDAHKIKLNLKTKQSPESQMQIESFATDFIELEQHSPNAVAVPLSNVVWNPWVDKSISIADLGVDQYKNFVCVEPGVVNQWYNLKPAHSLELTQILTPL